ncbi:type II secretion system F family protein [Glutamicibacter arilaitensis]|uniref:type II secretion system F family protein n=1 Tax=Glutamicibacter arilaitensis TaxID=256701 RepID=UPI00384C74FA
MLILLLCAVAFWLWFPRTASTVTAGRPWLHHSIFKSSRRRNEPKNVWAEDARTIRELAALVRSGLTFYPAVEALLAVDHSQCPVHQALHQLRATHRLGARSPSPAEPTAGGVYPSSVHRMHWCLKVSARSGASLADVLERLADDLEADLIASQAFDAAMAGPKATTKLLTWLPLVGFGAGMLLGIDVLGALATSWAAQLSVLLGMVLWLLNRLWCRYLLRTTTRQALQ